MQYYILKVLSDSCANKTLYALPLVPAQ